MSNINKWIAVKDQLPIPDTYFCYFKMHSVYGLKDGIDIFYFDGLNNRFKIDFDGQEVTHYMALPEKPNE